MASLSNDTGATCVIKVSLSPDTGTLQQALIGHDNTRTKASLSNDTGATTRSLFWKATSSNLTNHMTRVPAAASIEVLQGPLRHPIRSACTDRALQVITPGRSRCSTGLKYLLLHVLEELQALTGIPPLAWTDHRTVGGHVGLNATISRASDHIGPFCCTSSKSC